MKFDELLPFAQNANTLNESAKTIAATINDPTKAPGRFPYPLDTIMDDLAEAYLQLHNAREKLALASENQVLEPDKKERLKFLRDKIALCAKETKETAIELDLKFTLAN